MTVICEHPEITWVLSTGYPSWKQPKTHYCGECGKNLDSCDTYEDETYDYLCRECLLMLHEKRRWW